MGNEHLAHGRHPKLCFQDVAFWIQVSSPSLTVKRSSVARQYDRKGIHTKWTQWILAEEACDYWSQDLARLSGNS